MYMMTRMFIKIMRLRRGEIDKNIILREGKLKNIHY